MNEVKEGVMAPAFALKDKNGTRYLLNDIRSRFTIVYFYPRDNTPGCTVEAQEFTADLDEFQQLGATVIGISGGDEKSKARFCQKHDIRVTLLSDPDYSVAAKYGAYGEKKFLGKLSLGISRKTFVLDEDKRIIRIWHKVKAAGHSKEVLAFLQENGRGDTVRAV